MKSIQDMDGKVSHMDEEFRKQTKIVKIIKKLKIKNSIDQTKSR
jgi:hypothetical protein